MFIGTFNEHIAQPQANPYYAHDSHATAMGFGDSGPGGAPDAAASQLWVDMYGDGVTRDLEPSVSDQGSLWVQGLRHHVGLHRTYSSAMHRLARAVHHALLGVHAHSMRIGACNPML